MSKKKDCIVNLTNEKDGYIVETDGSDWYLGGKKEAVQVSESAAKWAISRLDSGPMKKSTSRGVHVAGAIK